MDFVSRQFSGFVVPSVQTDATADQVYVWQLSDKPLKYILQLYDGKTAQDTITLGTLASTTLSLPNKYDSTKNLCALILSDTTIKVTTAMPTPISQTSVALLRAGLNQKGVMHWCGVCTSIVLTNPQASTATIDYALFELPDITQATAWRIGSQATGVQQGAATASGWV